MIDEKALKTAQIIEKTTFTLGQREQTDQWDIYKKNGTSLCIATDRMSAFQRLIGTVPFKGHVIAEATAFFAEMAKEIVASDIVEQPQPRVLVVQNLPAFPVSFVVHGFITNGKETSAWAQYKKGIKNYYGHNLPSGLKENQRYEKPIVVPLLNGKPIAKETIFAEGLVDEDLFEEAADICLKLFAQGSLHAEKQGLLLVNAIYEFGVKDAQLVLLRGFHLPGTAKYWFLDAYEQKFSAGESQKEFMQTAINDWMHAVGFEGNGPAPPMPDEIRFAAAKEYISLGEKLMGKKLKMEKGDVLKEIEKVL